MVAQVGDAQRILDVGAVLRRSVREGGAVLRDVEGNRAVEVADTSEKRRVGLLKHERLEPGGGLWISPCESVHTFFMKFPIDVVFVDRQGFAVKIVRNLRPWRIALATDGRAVTTRSSR